MTAAVEAADKFCCSASTAVVVVVLLAIRLWFSWVVVAAALFDSLAQSSADVPPLRKIKSSTDL